MRRRILHAMFDVSELSDEQADYLVGEVLAQAEASDGHPDVEAQAHFHEEMEARLGPETSSTAGIPRA